MDSTTVLADARRRVARRDHADAPRLHRHPRRLAAFDADWARERPHRRAVDLVAGLVRRRPIAGLTVDVAELPDRTPLIVIEVPASACRAGGRHRAPLRPPRQAARDVRLAGRARAVDARGGGRPALRPGGPTTATRRSRRWPRSRRCSGGRCPRPLPRARRGERGERLARPAGPPGGLAERIGTPSLVVCLDSGCNDYERLWVTTSAGTGRRHADGRHPRGGRALGRPAVSCRARSASPASSSSGSRTSRRAR